MGPPPTEVMVPSCSKNWGQAMGKKWRLPNVVCPLALLFCLGFFFWGEGQMFVLLPTFGLVMFQLRKPSLIAISHSILESWHKNWGFFPFFQKWVSTKVLIHFVNVKGCLLWFESRFNPDRSNHLNVLMLSWKGYYLTKNNTVNQLLVTEKRATKSL